MRTILYLIRKEFSQISRNSLILRAVFVVPLLQMLILVPAVTFEIKNVRMAVVDHDLSQASRNLINRLSGSGFFILGGYTESSWHAEKIMQAGGCDLIITFPDGFEKEIITEGGAKLQVIVNAINAVGAQLTWSYLNGIIRDYNSELSNPSGLSDGQQRLPAITISNRLWYNEMLDYKHYMLPGILVILVTAISFLLSGLNMVKEKESGTIEQMNVTPVRKHQLIISKMFPFLLIGLADLSFGLVIGRIAFNVPIEGSLLTLFLGAIVFMTGLLGLALFISSFSDTQQQFMFIAFFFTMIFILMSGIFTPAESMPLWARRFNIVNPVAHLMKINRMVMLKGSGIADIVNELKALALIAIAFTSLAVWSYRKRVG